MTSASDASTSAASSSPAMGCATRERATTTKLLLIDEDKGFCRVTARALRERGFSVLVACTAQEAVDRFYEARPSHVVTDLRIRDGFGLGLVERLLKADRGVKIVVLTAYGSIATAVDAIRLGATYYLTKPVEAEDILAAFDGKGPERAALPMETVSVERLQWEHIQRVLQRHRGNVSATARSLGLHRRTLQRKLGRPPPGSR